MKTRSTLIAIIIAVGALAAAPLVLAGPGGRMHRMGGQGFAGHGMGQGGRGGFGFFGHLGRLQQELDLSDQQVQQIKGIFAGVHEQNAQYRDQLRGGFRDVAQTLLANPNDLAAAQARLDQQAAAERAMKGNLLAATSKALGVLTPEQRTKLGTLLEERAQRRAERRGR